MTKFIWNQALDIGNEKLNDEHRELIAIMEELQSLSRSGAPKVDIISSFERLIYYTRLHFQDEEKYMKEIEYQDLESHIKIHRGLIKTLENQIDEYVQGSGRRVPSSVFDFFQSWLTTHIMLVDKKYCQNSN